MLEKELILELKLLADVGLVGMPSVGKSTLISQISASKPKIAAYHFTTINPNLGVVGVPDGRSFVVADLPGLIEGAHQGLGLGIQFLKHIERTRVIVHIIDMSASDGRNPIDDYAKINHELSSYNMSLLERPQIVVANKMDLPGADDNLKKFIDHYHLDVIPISAITRTNLEPLLYKIADVLDEERQKALLKEQEIDTSEQVVEYVFKKPEEPFTITKDKDGVYNVSGPDIKRIFERTDFSKDANVRLFALKLRKMGVDAKLRELGVENGDTVRVLDYEFEFIE